MFGLKSSSLFNDTKKLEREIDGFVDILSEVGLVFKSIVPTYLNHSANSKFDELKSSRKYFSNVRETMEQKMMVVKEIYLGGPGSHIKNVDKLVSIALESPIKKLDILNTDRKSVV